ncbi:hypothetical protein DL766_006928 [Monosporascus sp. MC13-8B]|nr:hypothetical protein DL763_003131 [Monosporascus cannonballus]RYP25744.1 hypothetical protein DL766_006928 [Monosporascus sp. MC13-8B]
MDASGLSRIIQLFAYAMGGKPFLATAAKWGNQHRKELILPLRPEESALQYSHLRRPPVPNLPLSPTPSPS